MVRHRLDAAAHQELGGLVHRCARQAVDDARVAGVLVAQEVQQLAPGLVLGRDAVLDVRPVEAGDEVPRVLQLQPRRDLPVGGLGGGRGQRDARDVGPALVQLGQREIVRPEVVPPLRDAVRLVDREQRDLAPVQQAQRRLDPQPLRRQIEQIQLTGQELGLHQPPLVHVLRRVQESGPHPERPQRVHLVLHQRDQRRHDDPDPVPYEGRDLVAQRLAAAGRHEYQRVAAGDHMIDDLLLLAAEGVVAEDAVQYVEGALGSHPGSLRSRDHRSQSDR